MRSLPDKPSLRYLKLEAKRRLADGEFPALHDAHASIAHEHGLPSWTALKHVIGEPDGPAVAQLRWLVSRFRDAGDPGWAAPDDRELAGHFSEFFLKVIPARQLVEGASQITSDLRKSLEVIDQGPTRARARTGGLAIAISVEDKPPHRVTGLRLTPDGTAVADPRVSGSPPVRTVGTVPAEVAQTAARAFTELGLPALAIAGREHRDDTRWVLTIGWSDLDRAAPLRPGDRFPAYCAAPLVTATAVLALVADGRFGLDTRACECLTTLRLADETITVRELLSHTAGVNNPATLFAEEVQDLAAVMGDTVGCDGPRGIRAPTNGGYGVLGQIIEDVTGMGFTDAARRLVLDPLGMTASIYPRRAADVERACVIGYAVGADGTLVRLPPRVCVLPPIGGLWAPPADIVRLAEGWSTLLPESLAREARRPQQADGPPSGLGWLLGSRHGEAIVMLGGAAPGGTASLYRAPRRTHTTLTSRHVSLDSIDERLLKRSSTRKRNSHVPEIPGRRT